MPRGFLRSVTTSRGWRMTMEKMPVQRSVLARLPFVQVCSLHFTWQELSEIRTTLVTSTETDRKSVVSGKSVSVRVDIGGRRIIKKKLNLLKVRIKNII